MSSLSYIVLGAIAIYFAYGCWHDFGCEACRVAKQSVARTHPDWRIEGVSHRASAAEKDVVAVFYKRPDVIIHPSPYVLIEYNRMSGQTLELHDPDDNSPFAILGRK